MSVGEVEVERVAADYAGVFERKIFRDPSIIKGLFAGPFVNAAGAGTGPSEDIRGVMRLGIVRPLDRDLGFTFFNYLNGLYHT